MCSEHLSTRLRISKIIRSSKQRGGLGQSPANLFDLTSHTAKSTQNWEKQAVESELWKQNWGAARLPRCCAAGWGADKARLGCGTSCQQTPPGSAEQLPPAVGSSWPPSHPASTALHRCAPRPRVRLRHLMARSAGGHLVCVTEACW